MMAWCNTRVGATGEQLGARCGTEWDGVEAGATGTGREGHLATRTAVDQLWREHAGLAFSRVAFFSAKVIPAAQPPITGGMTAEHSVVDGIGLARPTCARLVDFLLAIAVLRLGELARSAIQRVAHVLALVFATRKGFATEGSAGPRDDTIGAAEDVFVAAAIARLHGPEGNAGGA